LCRKKNGVVVWQFNVFGAIVEFGIARDRNRRLIIDTGMEDSWGAKVVA
jgi:hypothetical protein